MSSRDLILQRIKRNRPSDARLPTVPDFSWPPGIDLVEKFKIALERVGGRAIALSPQADLKEQISILYPGCQRIASRNALLSRIEISDRSSTDELRRIELAVLRGRFGVAENGAVWVPEEEMIHRAVPFIAEHLILLLSRGAIVENMHQAYKLVPPSGYGVFIAGPSKTADIEQSLVIGAHGPRSLTVLLE
ncbi:LutC/YkgG family protein [Pyrinomonas methylaliphatogenes]|jgi:L-lactate dehydrogenase complex protein LldG|uniref:LUD domain-containing protein n=1 Tax=Pyrinomonas methylaliphatogenes TaxID=454194 RepID=A0A0B6WXN9_9BACT|nr:LUD domain-containing protein [Pyrinomonas methylaliphatogenes]MBX5477986.1 LUD domain-containing protein [Pyrinomonas methylaliphatogenes]CDM65044.1 hypothetical protein PYK22_01041 [Pyrinomonas methylaliphatogenes]